MSTQLAFANAQPAPGTPFPAAAVDPALQYADAAPVWLIVVCRIPAGVGGAARGLLSSLHRTGEQFAAPARQPRRLCRFAERRHACALHRRPCRAKGRHRPRRQDRGGLRPAAPSQHADRRGRARRPSGGPGVHRHGQPPLRHGRGRIPADRARSQRPRPRRHRDHQRRPYRSRREGAWRLGRRC